MKKIFALLNLFAGFSLVLAACGILPQPTPSITPFPAATFTPVLINTPTRETVIELGERRSIAEGGYSFRPPVEYEVAVQGTQAGIYDPGGAVIISMLGATTNPQNRTADEILDELMRGVFREGVAEYEKENPHTIRIDGTEGIAYDITGTLYGSPFRGQAIIVMPSENQFVFGFGFAHTSRNGKEWENNGSNVFNSLLESIQFSASEQQQALTDCTISVDPTYGFTQENPIRVGSGFIDGPMRERAFLDNLLGPNGEPISYVRNGSVLFGDTMLDAYEVTVAGKTQTLYIDLNRFAQPQAPVGFVCTTAFPFSEP